MPEVCHISWNTGNCIALYVHTHSWALNNFWVHIKQCTHACVTTITCIYIFMYTCMHACTYVYVHVCTYVHMYLRIQVMYVRTYLYTYISM